MFPQGSAGAGAGQCPSTHGPFSHVVCGKHTRSLEAHSALGTQAVRKRQASSASRPTHGLWSCWQWSRSQHASSLPQSPASSQRRSSALTSQGCAPAPALATHRPTTPFSTQQTSLARSHRAASHWILPGVELRGGSLGAAPLATADARGAAEALAATDALRAVGAVVDAGREVASVGAWPAHAAAESAAAAANRRSDSFPVHDADLYALSERRESGRREGKRHDVTAVGADRSWPGCD